MTGGVKRGAVFPLVRDRAVMLIASPAVRRRSREDHEGPAFNAGDCRSLRVDGVELARRLGGGTWRLAVRASVARVVQARPGAGEAHPDLFAAGGQPLA